MTARLSRRSGRILVVTILVAALATFAGQAGAATAPGLETAGSFAVLGGSTVTNTGPSVISGNLGVSPESAVTGFPPGLVIDGTIYAADAVALQAQADALIGYNDLAGQDCPQDLTDQDLGGLTLIPGVYCFSSSAQLTGTLTLDAQDDPNAVFIFQIGTTLTTASNSSVDLINGADPCNVFFQVGSSATLGTDTTFVGTIVALTSITATTGASVQGRLLALNGAVTLDTNNVTRPSCTTDGGGGSTTGSSTGTTGSTGGTGSSTGGTTGSSTGTTGTTGTTGSSTGGTGGGTGSSTGGTGTGGSTGGTGSSTGSSTGGTGTGTVGSTGGTGSSTGGTVGSTGSTGSTGGSASGRAIGATSRTASAGSTLPRTGTSLTAAAVGLLAVILGGVMLLVSRRRSASRTGSRS